MRTAGYTSKNPLAPNVLKDHPLISGWKQILVHEVFSEFYLLTFIDEWGDSGGMSRFELSNTFGERIILWYMQYKGTYPKKVIQFLKSALAAGYEEDTFYGGRGPSEYFQNNEKAREFGELRYTNVHRGTFSQFESREEIEIFMGGQIGDPWKLLGSHICRGGMCIPVISNL
jgi:hypothetical protein